jgi:hypothetical protein
MSAEWRAVRGRAKECSHVRTRTRTCTRSRTHAHAHARMHTRAHDCSARARCAFHAGAVTALAFSVWCFPGAGRQAERPPGGGVCGGQLKLLQRGRQHVGEGLPTAGVRGAPRAVRRHRVCGRVVGHAAGVAGGHGAERPYGCVARRDPGGCVLPFRCCAAACLLFCAVCASSGVGARAGRFFVPRGGGGWVEFPQGHSMFFPAGFLRTLACSCGAAAAPVAAAAAAALLAPRTPPTSHYLQLPIERLCLPLTVAVCWRPLSLSCARVRLCAQACPWRTCCVWGRRP